MVNVANGNLVVQADDVDVPERGIDLAFRRTYNSQSAHDSAGTDGSTPSLYGNGWTNTFDAHVSYDSATQTMSVYDIDGARYDYASDGAGHWVAPPGMQGTSLTTDAAPYLGYVWTKKSGTVYYFYTPLQPSSTAGYAGRTYQIIGRNHNNVITFTYSWTGNNSANIGNLTAITAQHSDGQTMVETFALFGANLELASLTRPDNAIITYSYDTSGNLIEVTRPGNASYATLSEQYWYYAGTHELQCVAGPRYVWSAANTPGALDGGYTGFAYSANIAGGQLQFINDYALVNPVVNDTVSQGPIQGGASAIELWHQNQFTYNAGSTAFTDTQGHATTWTPDANGRVTETQDWNGSEWLVTAAAWDANNDLASSTDARGQTTTYTYDANGNTLSVTDPQVATSLGTIYPTARYAYDSFNNLTAYCDPNAIAQSGATTCSAVAGTTHYIYDYSDTTVEPFGRLADTYTPLGYHHAISYNTSLGDVGLPSSVTGDCMSQADGTQRCPSQTFTYNATGTLASYNTGSGTWLIAYDALNRPVQRTDPDGVISYTYYNPDGSVAKTESAFQHVNGWGTSISYDADGNELLENVWRQQSAATGAAAEQTKKFYDGEDRLIEVVQPRDPSNDTYSNAWMTRYLYDITENATVSYTGVAPFYAHGNLFETQELLPATPTVTVTSAAADSVVNNTWTPLKATAFDALDRPVASYSQVNVAGTSTDAVSTQTTTYDAPTYYGGAFEGLPTATCNGMATPQCSYPDYDARGATINVHFNDASSPDRSMQYDPDGRTVAVTSPAYGTQSYSYDADGRETQEIEASGGGATSPATFTHEYYADGKMKQLDVSSSALNQPGLFAYSYRADGRTQTQTITDAAQANVGTTSVAFTYKPSGRIATRSESGTGANATPTTWTYDPTYGYLTGTSYPASLPMSGEAPSGTFAATQYDPQGMLLQYSTGANAGLTYTVRGELIPPQAPSVQPPTNRFANGATLSIATGTGVTSSSTIDGLMGTTIGTTSTAPQTGGTTATTTSGFTYDAAGRMLTSGTVTNAITNNASGFVTRGYDVENHTVSSSYTSNSTHGAKPSYLGLYNWGLSGHPVRIGSATGATSVPLASQVQYDTLHWDGDQLIFVTNSAGQVDDIKIGTSGDIAPLDQAYTGLTFWDRGPGGGILYCHNATGAWGAGSMTATNAAGYTNPCGIAPVGTFSAPSSMIWSATTDEGGNRTIGVGQGKVMGMLRTDGFSDGLNTFQGVRTVDAIAGTWTTPDAYAGDVDDPGTQKSYMWNGNNPVAYSDPSGYYVMSGFGTGGGAWDGTPDTQQTDVAPLFGNPQFGGGYALVAAASVPAATKLAQLNAQYDPNNGTYATAAAAAEAASKKFSQVDTTDEIGCEIYCAALGCSYGTAVMGDVDHVEIPVSDFRGTASSPAGIWHSHPNTSQISSLDDHTGEMHDRWTTYHFGEHLDVSTLVTFTTLSDGRLYGQDYNGVGSIGVPYLIK